jgi:phage shock protein C
MKRFHKIEGGGLYRSRRGAILGVCRGVAEYLDFSVFWTRAIAIVFLIFTGLWPILGLYFLAALLMKPEPPMPIKTEEEEEFYDSYVHSRRGAVDRLKRRYDNLELRIQKMEGSVTAKEFDWERRLNG